MPVRIDVEPDFDLPAALLTSGLRLGFDFQEPLHSATPKYRPKAFAYYGTASPATSTTTASDYNGEYAYEARNSLKECEEHFDVEDRGASFVPFLDPLDWDDVADADRRFFVASELIALLDKHGGQLLLSKVASVLTDETRLALRGMRIRLLTFLKEAPQRKYFRVEGAGGGQLLILRDLRYSDDSEDSLSLDAVRAELKNILEPCRRRNAMLLRSLGSSLSHSAKATLKANRLNLSQFLAIDEAFVLRKSHVYLAEPDVLAQGANVIEAPPMSVLR
jgi:hypothetical protein